MKTLQKLMAAVLAVSLPLTSACAADSGYMNIADLRAQCADGWHQTYEAHGRAVTVDVPIDVPDVQACPVLTIARGALPDEAVTQAYTQQQRLGNVGKWTGTMGAPDEPSRQSSWKEQQFFASDAVIDVTPENNATTFAEAWSILDKAFQSVYGFGMENFAFRSTTVYERTYRYQIKNGERVWGQAETEKGFYDIWANQLLHGIALAHGPDYTHYASGALPMVGECGGNVIDAQRYLLTMQYVVEQAVEQEDVPLLPFDTVKSRLEAQIADGLIREISDVELQYIGFFDPSDSTINHAVPVWHVRAVHATDAAREYEGWHIDKRGDYAEDRPWEDLYFLAQTGEYLDPESTAHNRRDVPRILTWDDVQ